MTVTSRNGLLEVDYTSRRFRVVAPCTFAEIYTELAATWNDPGFVFTEGWKIENPGVITDYQRTIPGHGDPMRVKRRIQV